MRLLLRPRVWLSATVPVLALLFAWAYWDRPEWLTSLDGDRPLQSAPSPAGAPVSPPELLEPDPAAQELWIGDRAQIDLDNLPVLGARRFPSGNPLTLGEPIVLPSGNSSTLKAPTQSTPTGLSTPSAIAPLGGTPLVPELGASRSRSGADKPDSVTNTVTIAPTATPGLPNPAIAPSSSAPGNIPPSYAPAQPLLSASPLESALQRQSASNGRNQPLSAATEPAAQSMPNSGLLPSSPSGTGLQPVPGQPVQPTITPAFSTPTLPGPYTPRTSPPPGTTGYMPPLGVQPLPTGSARQQSTMPSLTSPAATSGSQVPGSVGVPGTTTIAPAQPQFGSSDFYAAPAVPEQPRQPTTIDPSAPFSAPPRPRNGEFNTFSNP
ncbi:MAG: hypothetical protein Fur0046_03920 [Cyanobacteria bacterium J069]|nr:MAG: hypothetical protein D6742_16660 [Cyanobacteria bacterium J069]